MADNTEAQLVDALKELIAENDERNRIARSEPGYGGYPDTGGMAYARTLVNLYMAQEHPGLTVTQFECPECEHAWEGVVLDSRNHAWETCPSCGVDDGENCWDCGITSEDENMDMCTNCRHTICGECEHPHSHDPRGRVSDGGECGHTTRVI